MTIAACIAIGAFVFWAVRDMWPERHEEIELPEARVIQRDEIGDTWR